MATSSCSTPEAFQAFLSNLELTDSERNRASRQQTELRDRLRRELAGILRDVLVGSYARRTAVRPLNDIDIFLELDPKVHSYRRDRPVLLLEDIQRALRNCYPQPPSASSQSPATRIQNRSVNIEFIGTGIGYDIIPAFLVQKGALAWSDQGDVYEIPDRNQRQWIRTAPEAHQSLCTDANQRAKQALNPLIKAAKHWNQSHRNATGEKPLSSFHLEAMAYSAFPDKPADTRHGLHDLLTHLLQNMERPCPDPAGLGPDVSRYLQEDLARRHRTRELLTGAVRLAHQAVGYETAGNHEQACAMWRELLGPAFPR